MLLCRRNVFGINEIYKAIELKLAQGLIAKATNKSNWSCFSKYLFVRFPISYVLTTQ